MIRHKPGERYHMLDEDKLELLRLNSEHAEMLLRQLQHSPLGGELFNQYSESPSYGNMIEDVHAVGIVAALAAEVIGKLLEEISLTRKCAEARRLAVDTTFKRFVALRDKYEPKVQ